MAPTARWLAAPIAFAWTAAGWATSSWATGTTADVGRLLWSLPYLSVFWGGWLAIPVLGVGATFAQPMLPERWRAPVRGWFVGWLLAWIGVLAAVWWLGPPPGFEAVPT
ncbi:hypothetical protein BRD56_03605 [Thermoplasmatales archaeon SW_10_69_26]|nr:MAG: hypothetical protein BRD56_03605 [Thermoplasmatales archaeon SW_10_69_26]